jgi:hypothetical protein
MSKKMYGAFNGIIMVSASHCKAMLERKHPGCKIAEVIKHKGTFMRRQSIRIHA